MTLAKYRLSEPLETDKVCLRYNAEDAHGELVEIRVLPDGWTELPDRDRKVRQWRLARHFHDPSFQRIVDIQLDENPAFVVLERLVGPDLEKVQASSPLDELTSLRLGATVAETLAKLHRLGLYLGLLDPKAVMTSAERSWKLEAGGLFWPATERTAPYRHFRAPEAESEGAEAASDVYALAGLLNWLLNSSHAGSHLEEWSRLSEECLAPDPGLRPSADEMVNRLSEVLETAIRHAAQTVTVGSKAPADDVHQDQTLALEIAPIATASLPLSGQKIGAYEILEKLGEGGMGTVYRARDLGDERIVAIKVLSRSLVSNESLRRRFAKEARMLARANNPYVANLLEFNEDAGLSYLSVEFVSGGSLGDWLKTAGHCDEAMALALISDAARGLSVAHQRGIVHRDIKPDNLLLTELGRAYLAQSLETPPAGEPLLKLSDFGLARADQQSESLAITYDGMVLGTPYYMSPEQCQGRPADPRSDVYSLGATLFHLLAGRLPFEGETNVAVMNKHVHEAPPSLRKLRPELSESTERVVARCLAKNPEARYADAEQLCFEIESLRRGQPASIVLHPRLPASDGDSAITFQYEWELESSPEQLWPYVSNTDRVNHAMGLPTVRYRTETDPERGVRRFATSKFAGQDLVWEEHPYEWIEGQRMSVLREFQRGPLVWFASIVELKPRSGGGTSLAQTISVQPKSSVGRWFAKLAIGARAGRSLARIYQQVDDYLISSANGAPRGDAFGKGVQATSSQRAKLTQRLEALRAQHVEPAVVETLGQFLESASEQEVARIRPLSFAERFQLESSQVIAACLWGAREGLLVLLWDILCPTCRIPSDVTESLTALKDHGHCDACNLDFKLDFSSSVELIFRAHPDLRHVETRTYCIGGPAFSAHVVAQSRLNRGERFQMELNLSDGAYRVRGPQIPFNVDFRVAPRGSVGRWELSLLRPPPRHDIPVLQSNRQVITLANETSTELLVRLERLASRHDALTAAEASSMALFRRMFPGQILSPGRMVAVTSVTFLLINIPNAADLYSDLGDGPAFESIQSVLERASGLVAEQGGAVVKAEGDGLLAVFRDSAAGLRTSAELLDGERSSTSPARIRLAIHRGPAMVTTLNDRLDYFGSTLHVARQLLANASERELLITDRVFGSPENQSFLAERFQITIADHDQFDPTMVVYRCWLNLK